MLTIFRSTKGGSGTSTVAAGFAGVLGRHASRHSPTPAGVLAIDLCGDLPAVLGSATPLTGLSEWLDRSHDHDFNDVCVDCGHSVSLLPAGSSPLPDPTSPAWNRLASILEHHVAGGVQVIVDAGTGPLPQAFTASVAPTPVVSAPVGSTSPMRFPARNLLVIRPCYLALRRAIEETSEGGVVADGIVLVNGEGRVLTRRDVESVLGVPVVAEVPLDPDVARRVDSGLFLSRLPATLVSSLEPLVRASAP